MTVTSARSTPDTTPAVPALDPTVSRSLLEGLYLELTAELEQATSIVTAVAADRDGEDEGDVGSRTSQQEHEYSVAATIRARRDQVESALTRIDNGTYGLCSECHQPIPAERLEAFPQVTECVTCKQAIER